MRAQASRRSHCDLLWGLSSWRSLLRSPSYAVFPPSLMFSFILMSIVQYINPVWCSSVSSSSVLEILPVSLSLRAQSLGLLPHVLLSFRFGSTSEAIASSHTSSLCYVPWSERLNQHKTKLKLNRTSLTHYHHERLDT